MSKAPFNKRVSYPPEKNVFVTPTIPDMFKDQIRSYVNSGEYGKLEELLINYPVNLTFSELNLDISLLHSVIQSQLTKIQKANLVKLLIKHGIAIDNLDQNGYTPLYYAIKQQDFDLVKLLIDNHSKLNKLSKNYDYFRLALEPHIGQCKSQLFSVSDQAMMSKYYSQQMKLEKDLKSLINSQPITQDIIKYLLEFVKRLPDQKLEYFDLTTNSFESSINIKLEDDGARQYLPEFENKLYYKLEDITKDIFKDLQSGAINQDQIISKKIDLTKSIQSELKTLLDTKSLDSIPRIRDGFIYDSGDLVNLDPEVIYTKFIERGDFSPVNLFGNLANKYQRVQDIIIQDINNILQLIDELITIQSSDPNNLDPVTNDVYIGLFPNFVNLTILKTTLDGFITGGNLGVNLFDPNDSNLLICFKFIEIIKICISIYQQIFNDLEFQNLINPNFQYSPNNRQNNRIISILDELRDSNNIVNLCKRLNQFVVEINNVSEAGILYYKYIQPNNDPTQNNEKLLFSDNFDLLKFDDNDMNIIPRNIEYTSQKNPSYYNIPNDNVTILNFIDNSSNIALIKVSNDPTNFPNPNPTYPLIYTPENIQIINLKVISSIYHEKVFKTLLDPQNNSFNNLRTNFQNQNPSIQIDQINKLLLTTLDAVIKKNFKELVNLSLLTSSGSLIDTKLLRNPIPQLTDQNIKNILTKKLKLVQINREDKQQEFYLDENYTSSEPIDIISCINNNRKIIELLKKNMHIDPKEYQDLIFKLGNPDILQDLNTRNKITKNELNLYLSRHTQKFKDALLFLNTQLDDEIKSKSLDFIVKNILITYLIDKDYFNADITNKQISLLNLPFTNIYTDLIDKQTNSNLYLTTQIRSKLNILFRDIIIPQIEKFLQFFVDKELDQTINYNNIQEDLKPIIDNIIYYHMNIDPTKSKETQIPLETSVEAFSNLFINPLDEDIKTKLITIYNDRLKSKIIDLLTILCKYYGSVYRNFLKYIFNDVRYSKLDGVLP
jgi:hypothetical protein